MRQLRRLGAAAVALTLLATAVAGPLAGGAAEKSPSWTSLNDSFVTRDGSGLKIGDRPFRFAGTNIYWLGLDENVDGVGYPTFFRIRDVLDTAKAMGLTVVRSHMLISTGHPLTLLPSKEAGLNDEAFRTIDYAIAYAGKLGLRLVLPLTDNWDYYHGGIADFTGPYGLPDAAFYSDPRVIADYQAYVKLVVHRVNALTGKRYVDDPTVMAWELGNELEGMTPAWTAATAATLARWAPRQLIAAGRRAGIDPAALRTPDVDIVDVHYYPPTAEKVRADAAAVAAAGKVFVAGEYASTATFLQPLTADRNVTGVLSWSLFGHHDRHGFVQHDDGFTFHYPGGADLAAYAAALGAPAWRPTGPPLITSIAKRGGLNVLQWRGAAGAGGYRVERSRTAFGAWRPAHEGLLTDDDTPWTDPASPGNAWYRVVTADGRRSEPQYVRAAETVLIDPLEDLGLASGHAGVSIEAEAVLRPAGPGPAWVSWNLPGVRRISVDSSAGYEVQVSPDGAAWRTVRSYAAELPAGDHVRVLLRGPVSRVTLWAADPAPVAGPPEPFELMDPAAEAAEVIGPGAFMWAHAVGAGSYALTVSRRADLRDPVIDEVGLSETTFTPPQTLGPATTWYWQVRASNAAGSTWSEVRTFRTRPA